MPTLYAPSRSPPPPPRYPSHALSPSPSLPQTPPTPSTSQRARLSAFPASVHAELVLPEYDSFEDYNVNEMVTQFGHVVLWSATWPLAPAMALIRNWLFRAPLRRVQDYGACAAPGARADKHDWA
ncbi:DUF590-domain-containing protein [Mycena kentingensis (nom. inval.)]|nr:DUF590-domain-containing protein [Mycena kentingensis (nom. inval.)]